MKIEFMFHNIKDINLIYSHEEKYNEDWAGIISEVNYLGTEYTREIVEKIKDYFPEVKAFDYNGQRYRIANEEYQVLTMENKYLISFTINTFDDKTRAQLFISLESDSMMVKYDSFLEKLKIFTKEILLKDWEICTWIIDEQSERLGMDLYLLIYKTENRMRAFVNKVLIYKFGVKWMELIGFEGIKKEYDKNNVVFKREVPEFNNINDILISSTAESLVKLMRNSKVYDTSFEFSDKDSVFIHKMIAENSQDKIFEKLRKLRIVKVDIWKDLFEKYFDEDIDKSITDFIKNRNHVAHNKLLTKNSFEKMKENILTLEKQFENANELFDNNEPSNELNDTWDAEQEEIYNEKEYIYERIRDETGIDILFSNEIFELFKEKIDELYTSIDDSEYFNNTVIVHKLESVYNNTENRILFTVESKVDKKSSFNVCASFEITEGMGEDSYMHLWVEKSDSTRLFESSVEYHNGEAYENAMECYYIPEGESYFNDKELETFIDEIKTYISEEMNSIKQEMDYRCFIARKDGGDLPVADFPCWNCNENYISVDNDLYHYGHCVNCGEENEVFLCKNCGILYSTEDGGVDLCNNCLDKVHND